MTATRKNDPTFHGLWLGLILSACSISTDSEPRPTVRETKSDSLMSNGETSAALPSGRPDGGPTTGLQQVANPNEDTRDFPGLGSAPTLGTFRGNPSVEKQFNFELYGLSGAESMSNAPSWSRCDDFKRPLFTHVLSGKTLTTRSNNQSNAINILEANAIVPQFICENARGDCQKVMSTGGARYAFRFSNRIAPIGQQVQIPMTGYNVFGDIAAIVLFASPTTITVGFRLQDDGVSAGYVIHYTGIRVDRRIVDAYQNSGDRTHLPGLRANSPIGRVDAGKELVIAVRDTGTFLDLREPAKWGGVLGPGAMFVAENERFMPESCPFASP